MSSRMETKESHFSLGSDDDLDSRRIGTYAADFVTIPQSCYVPAQSDGSTSELRKHHFQFGTEKVLLPVSTNRASFVPHSNVVRVGLSESVRKDLRSSHFALGGLDSSPSYQTSSMAGFPRHQSRAERAERDVCSTAIFGFEEDCNYESEFRAAFLPYSGREKAHLAKSVQDDLRRSHWNHTSKDSGCDYSTTSHVSYTRPCRQASTVTLKPNMTKSNITFY